MANGSMEQTPLDRLIEKAQTETGRLCMSADDRAKLDRLRMFDAAWEASQGPIEDPDADIRSARRLLAAIKEMNQRGVI